MSGLVFAAGRPWPRLLRSVLDQLDPPPDAVDLGLVFLADPATEMADVVLDGLKGRTGIRTWLGAASTGVFAGGRELAGEGAIVALPLALPRVDLLAFAGRLPTAAAAAAAGILHLPAGGEAGLGFARLAAGSHLSLIGGQTASAFDHAQITLTPSAGAATGLLLSGEVRLVVGISHGLRPLGPVHRVTGGRGDTLLALDGLPAADILAREVGDLLLREPRRLSRQLVAVGGGAPCGIGVVDRQRGAVQLADLPAGVALPTAVRFARRDPALALRELTALASDLRQKLDGRPPQVALLYSSTERGPGFYGPGVDEAAVLAAALGPVPLIGMRTQAEVAGAEITRYAAALALLA